jgi:hypothetical protein
MSLISLDRIGEQRIRTVDPVGQGEVEIVFRARTDNPLDGQSVVLGATNVSSNQGQGTLSIPPPWAPYGPPYVSATEQSAAASLLTGSRGPATGGPGACLCYKRVARQTDNNQTWEITCTFSAANPLNVPWKITFHDEQVKIGIDADINGLLIRNSFGDPFSNACEVESSLLRMHVVANVPTYDPVADAALVVTPGANPNARQTQYQPTAGVTNVGGPVNIDTWWGFPSGTVRYRPGGTEWVNDLTEVLPYFRREFDFLINAAGWKYQPLDCGYRCFADDGITVRDPIQGTNAQRRSGPSLLDGFGLELPRNLLGQYSVGPVFLEFTIYPAIDFSVLGLGTARPW